MNRENVQLACLSAIAACLMFGGIAIAQATKSAPPVSPPGDAVGPDVLAAVRQWAAGDPRGRRTLEAMARAGRADAQEALGEV
jgi:hypothetical protein